ncbi:DUF3237 domain-containing protein [Phenylobacterium terrae]|uniref:UPF0311 protein ACFSC0_00500 n=1 Tax=Phenylobacterium terrae TaxID=2665495 RepID=A0ABW4MV58_9CAUL
MSIAADAPFLVIEADVSAPFEPGHIGAGARRCIPIVGGRVSGQVAGEIIPGGADWQTIHDDGNLQIEAHYAFRTADGDIVEVISSGVRSGPPDVLARLGAGEAVDPSLYYFRTSIRFRTGAPRLAHLNWKLGIAKGARRPGGVRLEVFEVL